MSHLRFAWPQFRMPDIKRRKFPWNKQYPISQICTTSPYAWLNHMKTILQCLKRDGIMFFNGKFPGASRPIYFFKCFFLANRFQGLLYMGYQSYYLSVYSKSSSGNPSPFCTDKVVAFTLFICTWNSINNKQSSVS
jgi:hypothetical protein